MLQSFKVKNERYPFWKVFWVVLTVNAVLLLFSTAVILGSSLLGKDYDWNKYLSLPELLKQVVSMLITVVFFYYSLNHFNYLLVNRKKTIYYLRACVICIFAIIAYHIVLYSTIEIKVEGKLKHNLNGGLLIFTFAISGIFTTGISLLIAYLNSLRDEKKQRKILEAQKMQLEVEKSQANLNFLKAQINPHFLHNTLNFLYAKSLPLSAELSEGILTLSDIMRYALNDENTKDGKALLKDEIEHVKNVIKINQLRFSNKLNVEFDVNGVISGVTIIPFVLITIVENAFKHGDLKSPENPIKISVCVEGHKLYFYCNNKKKTGPKELSTGLGLDNIKKRLDLAYGNDYALSIKDELNFYTTELTINNL
jgi:two-component system, LytTR family, sensor kinase